MKGWSTYTVLLRFKGAGFSEPPIRVEVYAPEKMEALKRATGTSKLYDVISVEARRTSTETALADEPRDPSQPAPGKPS